MMLPFSFWKQTSKIPDGCPIEAVNFIKAHELQTGQPMGFTQKTAVCTLVSMLQGNGTTNGTDLWTGFVDRGTVIYPLCPIDDTTATATAYEMELFTCTKKGEYVNFLPSDITVKGVDSGNGKYFKSGVLDSDFPARNGGGGVYTRIPYRNGNGPQFFFGLAAASSRSRYWLYTNYFNTVQMTVTTNSSNNITFPKEITGWITSQRSGTYMYGYLNGEISEIEIQGNSPAPVGLEFYFHARNDNGVATTNDAVANLSLYLLGLPVLNGGEQLDLYEAIQTYQTILNREIPNNVADRFIKAHEEATGVPMDTYQRTVVNTFVDMLYGSGTTNGTDLMTRFLTDGTTLFPLVPSNDNDAYLSGFEIDLISGGRQGRYVNMDDSHMTPQGALPSANGQYFEVWKSSNDFELMPGYAFTYYQDVVAVGTHYCFGNINVTTDSINCIPRASAGGGWSYVRWNGSSDAVLASRRFNGQVGVYQVNLSTNLDYTSGDGQRASVYGGYVTTPYRTNANFMHFHKSNGNNTVFPQRLSMYGFGIYFDNNETTAFDDLSEAIRYFQENILSNDSRRWV